jgi:hypothetical protein
MKHWTLLYNGLELRQSQRVGSTCTETRKKLGLVTHLKAVYALDLLLEGVVDEPVLLDDGQALEGVAGDADSVERAAPS